MKNFKKFLKNFQEINIFKKYKKLVIIIMIQEKI